MNCQLCKKEIDEYLEENPDPDLKIRIESHLRECKDCNEFYRIQKLAGRVISEEKQLTVNPFLATRIMARIENSESRKVAVLQRLLRPVLITVSMAIAVLAGVLIGSIPIRYQSDKTLPVELALIDDATIESIDLLSIE